MAKSLAPVVAILALMGMTSGCSESVRAQQPAVGVYAGTIGDAPIILTLDAPHGNEPTRTGGYCYQRIGSILGISGRMNANGMFAFEERGGKAGEVTGALAVQFTPDAAQAEGTWRSPDGKRSLALHLERVAVLDSTAWSTRTAHESVAFTCYFPRFEGQHPAALLPVSSDVLNAEIAHLVEIESQSYREMWLDTAAPAEPADPADTVVYEMSSVLSLRLVAGGPAFVSFAGNSEYYGGAHPSYGFPNYNYVVEDGRLREAKESDIFVEGSQYRGKLARIIFAEVKRSGYPCIDDLSPASFEDDELVSSFVVAGGGLLFRLWPGPHVCGPADDIYLSYTQLAGLVNAKVLPARNRAR